MARPQTPRPVATADLRVVELAGSVAGAYCAKLLADQGAEVTRLVDPSGRAVSTASPQWRAEGLPSPGVDLYLNVDKTVVDAEPGSSADGWSDFDPADPILNSADIVIRSSTIDPLPPWPASCPASVSAPGARDRIDVEISPFGSHGPRAGHRSSDLVDQAISGHLLLNGDPDREPIRGPEHQVGYAAGAHAAIGALAAVLARPGIERGQRIEVTHHEVMAALHQFTLLRYTHNGNVLGRMGNRYAGPGTPVGAYRCGDRMISLVVPRDDQLDRLLGVAGLDHLLDHPDIDSTYDLMHHPSLDEYLRPWLEDQDPFELVELLQAIRVPAGPVNTMSDVLADEQLTARDHWRTVEADGVAIRIPDAAFRTTRAKVTDRSASPSARAWTPGALGVELANGPLHGLRILDLARVWAGPFATRILADLGAEVVMVEAPWARGPVGIDRSSVLATHYYPDDDPGANHWNRIGFVNKYGVNKQGLALDLATPEGVAAFEAMVSEVDVVLENYSPRVMPQLGLSEERLHRLNPKLVYVTMPGFGRTGPASEGVAYGPMIGAHAGLSTLAGYPDDRARMAGVAWPDPVAGMHAAFATLAALAAVADDDVGRTVEVAQLEATVAMVGHALADAQLDGDDPELIGNRHPAHEPQGVYACAGDDRWLALTVVDDVGWVGLCRIAGFHPSWVDWSLADRRRAHDEIDRAIRAWTSNHEQVELADWLQSLRVPAAPVADAAMVMEDAHLRARSFFVPIEHPEAGTHEWPRLAIDMSETPTTYRCPAPILNQHGDELLAKVAGLDVEEIAALRTAGVVLDRPPF